MNDVKTMRLGKRMKLFLLFILCGGFFLALMIATGVAGVAWIWSFFRVPNLEIPATANTMERVEHIDRWLQQLHAEKRFNGAVLIVRDGEPLLMKTYGFTDHTARESLTNQSSFRLASVSKQFTAAGVLMLVARGTLELDRPVDEYLEDFPYRNVTIRHLLNQTSGVPDVYMSLAEGHRDEVGKVLTLTNAVDLINRYPARASIPGDAYAYSNTNYILLARIIEIVSSRTFEQFMGEELFEPLGMKNTRVWNRLSKERTFSNKTSDFNQLLGTAVEPSWLDGVAGDGAVFCSIEDFVIWDDFWRGNELISDDVLSQAFDNPKLNDGSFSNYGFGWVLTDDGAWHNGVWLGAATYISRGVHDRNCIVLLDNSSCLIVDGMIAELEREVADK